MKNKILFLALASLFATPIPASLFKTLGRRAIPAKKPTLFAIAQRYLLKAQLKKIAKSITREQAYLDSYIDHSMIVRDDYPFGDLAQEALRGRNELQRQALTIKAKLAKK